jgi:hypothetical protein
MGIEMALYLLAFLSYVGNFNDLQTLPLISQTSGSWLMSSSLYPDTVCNLQQPIPDKNVHYYDMLYLYNLKIPWPSN